MTEGHEVHKKESPRSVPANGQSTLVRRSSPEARQQSHLTWSRASSLWSADSALDTERDSDSEGRDGQEAVASEELIARCHDEEPEEQEREPGDRGKQIEPEAPDGGWGWMVVASTILVLALTLAFPSCIGIFYTDLQMEFHASNTETSWVPAIMTAVLHGGGRVHPPRTVSTSNHLTVFHFYRKRDAVSDVSHFQHSTTSSSRPTEWPEGTTDR